MNTTYRIKALSGFASWFAVCLGAILLLAGCGTMDPQHAANQGKQPLLSPDLLHPGDKVTITYADMPSPPPAMEQQISADGYITLYMNLRIKAAGKTTDQLQKDIHDKYVPNYFKHMTVTVSTQSRYFAVNGEVRNPSVQPYVGGMTVLKAIAAAGGFTDFAKKKRVQLTHPNNEVEYENCLKALDEPQYDLPVYPGDKIYVPRRVW